MQLVNVLILAISPSSLHPDFVGIRRKEKLHLRGLLDATHYFYLLPTYEPAWETHFYRVGATVEKALLLVAISLTPENGVNLVQSSCSFATYGNKYVNSQRVQ